MANKIRNANMSLDEILSEDEPAEVTPIVCGSVSQAEAEKAFDDMFRESEFYFNKIMNGIWR